MGIVGLLPALRSVTKPRHLRDYGGARIGVDAYVWLHRGVHAAASTASTATRQHHAYISFVERRVHMLLQHDIQPILVFDGGPLPAKAAQESERAQKRRKYLAAALECEANGNKAAAVAMFKKAVDVSPAMAKHAIDAIREKFGERVQCMVAPYEADAQLAWLAHNNVIDAVLTEDSDLLAFGCACVLFKLDNSGCVDEIRLESIGAATELDLQRWPLQQFRLMCILSGCDYAPSLPGMGIKKAHRLVLQYKTRQRTLRALRLKAAFRVPPGYEDNVRRAELTFEHQRVFNIHQRAVVPLRPLSSEFVAEFGTGDFLGRPIDSEMAVAIADAVVDPISCEKFDGNCAEQDKALRAASVLKSSASPPAKPGRRKPPLLSPPCKTRRLTEYFSRSSDAVRREFVAPKRRSGVCTNVAAPTRRRSADADPTQQPKPKPTAVEASSDAVAPPSPPLAVHTSAHSKFIRSGRLSIKRKHDGAAISLDEFRFREICERSSCHRNNNDNNNTALRAVGAGRRNHYRVRASECRRTSMAPLAVPLPVPGASSSSASSPPERSTIVGSECVSNVEAGSSREGQDEEEDGAAAAPGVAASMSITAMLCEQNSRRFGADQLRAIDFYRFAYQHEGGVLDQVLHAYDHR